MKVFLTAIFLSAIGFVFADDDVASAFRAVRLSPDMVKNPPTELVEVTYENTSVNLGTRLTALETTVKPTIHYEYESDALYTLIMIGPEPVVLNLGDREILHWLVGNIPGDEVSEGTVLAEYLLPVPVPVAVPHRYYAFLVYKQNQGVIDFNQKDILTELVERIGFSIEDFTEEYNLGDPVFGNFFRARLL